MVVFPHKGMFRSIWVQVNRFYGRKAGPVWVASHQKKGSRGFWSSWPLLSVGAAFSCPWTLQKSLRMCKDPGKGRPKGIHDARQGTNSHIPLETLDTLIKMGCMHSINMYQSFFADFDREKNTSESVYDRQQRDFPSFDIAKLALSNGRSPVSNHKNFDALDFPLVFHFQHIWTVPDYQWPDYHFQKKQFRITNGLRLNVFWSSKPPGPTIAGQWVLRCY